MILYVCSIFDRKVNAYMLPQFFRSKGEATRAFVDAVATKDAAFRKHAEDYVFMFLGFFDDASGVFTNAEPVPEVLMTALDCIHVEGSVN